MIQELNDEINCTIGYMSIITGVKDDMALDIAEDIGDVYTVVTGERDAKNDPKNFDSKLHFVDLEDKDNKCIIWHQCSDEKIAQMSIEDGVDTYVNLLQEHIHNDDGVQARDIEKNMRKKYDL
jgi:hypothetical protein